MRFFCEYSNNYIIYGYVVYIIRNIFLQFFKILFMLILFILYYYFFCIQMHEEMEETSQVKIEVFMFTGDPVYNFFF